jgi:hypothetical protein
MAKKAEPIIVSEIVPEGLTGREDGIVGMELLELGEGRRSPFADVKSKKVCEAQGGIWRKPPPWSKLKGVCAMPPPWAKSRSEMAVPGLLRGCDGAAAGAFIAKEDRCAPGYVKVRTRHPFYRKGEFYMCALPGTVPRIPAPGRLFGSGLGELRLLPEDISFPMLLIGNLTGIGVATALPRVLGLLKDKTEKPVVSTTVRNIVKLALGGGGASLYLLTKKSLPLGLALGMLPGAVTGLVDLIIPEKGKYETMGPPAPKALTGGMGQLEPEQIRELERIAEELTGPGIGQDEEYEEPELFGDIPEEIEEEPVIPATFF